MLETLVKARIRVKVFTSSIVLSVFTVSIIAFDSNNELVSTYH